MSVARAARLLKAAEREAISPAITGGAIRVHYHVGPPNWCPGCGRSNWIIGRFSAECAFCHTAIDIAGSKREGFSGKGWRAAA